MAKQTQKIDKAMNRNVLAARFYLKYFLEEEDYTCEGVDHISDPKKKAETLKKMKKQQQKRVAKKLKMVKSMISVLRKGTLADIQVAYAMAVEIDKEFGTHGAELMDFDSLIAEASAFANSARTKEFRPKGVLKRALEKAKEKLGGVAQKAKDKAKKPSFERAVGELVSSLGGLDSVAKKNANIAGAFGKIIKSRGKRGDALDKSVDEAMELIFEGKERQVEVEKPKSGETTEKPKGPKGPTPPSAFGGDGKTAHERLEESRERYFG